MSAEAAAPTLRRKRRIERLRREIILLEHLDSRLWRKIALCAGVSVLLLGLMMFGLWASVAVALHVHPAHPILILFGCLSIAMILYWVTNYSLSALWIATGVFFTLLALTLDPSALGDLNWSTSTKNPNERADHKKARKQMQIVAALQKRRDKLDDLLR